MALPTTVWTNGTNTLIPQDVVGRLGPFLSSGGNVYVIGVDTTDTRLLNAYKATDPTSSFTEVAATTLQLRWVDSIDCVQVGDVIHFFGGEISQKLSYGTFNMATDSFVIGQDTAMGENLRASPNSAEVNLAGLRSDGDVVATYSTHHKEMGTNYGSVQWGRREGTTWTDARFDDQGSSEVHVTPSGAVMGESDVATGAWLNHTTDAIDARTMPATGSTLGTPFTVSDNAADKGTNNGVAGPVYYDDGGVERITVAWRRNSNSQLVTSEIDDGTAGAEENASDNGVAVQEGAGGTGVLANMALDGKVVYLVYADDTDNDIYYTSNDDSGGWATDTEAQDAVSAVIMAGANVYTRSGTKYLAYLYLDTNATGAFKYNEISLSAAPAGGHVGWMGLTGVGI